MPRWWRGPWDSARSRALATPFVTTATTALLVASVAVGAASGATTVLRPLLVIDLVGPGGFAPANARLQRAASLTRAAGPAAVGLGATTIGWPVTWALTLGLFVGAADRYRRIDAGGCSRSNRRMDAEPVPPVRGASEVMSTPNLDLRSSP